MVRSEVISRQKVTHPAPDYKGRKVHGMQGDSMLAFLSGEESGVHEADHVWGMELFNRRMIRQGDWKLVWLNEPWGKNDWALFNVAEDIAEQNDLSASMPEKLQEMVVLWEEYVKQHDVFVFPDIEIGYTNGRNHYK